MRPASSSRMSFSPPPTSITSTQTSWHRVQELTSPRQSLKIKYSPKTVVTFSFSSESSQKMPAKVIPSQYSLPPTSKSLGTATTQVSTITPLEDQVNCRLFSWKAFSYIQFSQSGILNHEWLLWRRGAPKVQNLYLIRESWLFLFLQHFSQTFWLGSTFSDARSTLPMLWWNSWPSGFDE